jgi:SNF2 family DNA or RNA helicase
MPGFLGDRETFKRQFRQPIEQEGSTAMRDILTNRVRPFLLRRKKSEVARELPPKTILLRPVEMTKKQREVYDHVRAAMQLKVRAEIAEKGLARSKFVILEALTKLRQVCCDPRLADAADASLKPAHSAKLVELMSMLPDLVREDHRVLVFSQFTSMLALIEDELRAAKIGFVTLTGSTADRERPVADFQAGKVPVFLISLRAGGTGLNLTQADTVIHYDPWWNPQIENQATDRAYRIGQERPVFVHKLVTAESVEETIVAMQERKALLAEGILGGTNETGLAFAEEDVAELFG